MKTTRLAEAPNVPFALDGKVMSKSDELEIIHLRLNPGQKLEKHRNPFDTVFYILEGEAIIDTLEGVVKAEPDMVIELSQTIERSVENNGQTDFRMLVIKKLNNAGK
jgi:mannose-6-phosphate isomerase-like protein (cupin superfamily)